MKKILIILATLLITGCNSIDTIDSLLDLNIKKDPIKPFDLSYKLFDTKDGIEYKIQSEKLKDDIRVKAQCDSDKQKYSFSFIDDKNNGGRAFSHGSYGQDFFFNGKRRGYSRGYLNKNYEYNETEYLNRAINVQVSNRDRGKRFDITSPELLNLPTLCKNKYTELQENLAKRTKQNNERIKQKREKDARLVASVKKSTGLELMFSGDNEKSFDELVRIFRANGFSQHQNKFVWAGDGNYKVSQVLDGKVILTASYHFELPPITIVTNLPALEGQLWSNISRAPLKFIGVTNHTTVLGASKQSIVFQKL